MIKAEWGMDYDYHNDKCYKRPMHKECDAPIEDREGTYYCLGCGKTAEVTDDMAKWIAKRKGSKVDTETCIKCGKKTCKIVSYKNSYNLKWQVGHGECTNCGMKFIV